MAVQKYVDICSTTPAERLRLTIRGASSHRADIGLTT